MLFNSACTTGFGVGAKTCGVDGAFATRQGGSMTGTAASSRSSRGVETCIGVCTLVGFVSVSRIGMDAGSSAATWPLILSEKQVERELLKLAVRFANPGVFAKDAHNSNAATATLPKKRPSERRGDAPTKTSAAAGAGGVYTPTDPIFHAPPEVTAWPISVLGETVKALPEMSCSGEDKRTAAAIAIKAACTRLLPCRGDVIGTIGGVMHSRQHKLPCNPLIA
mmetsp:Transcript_113236/g.283556  ORF Transcript_113236/g.283556 Transcript_113236/m.283556 type:complete len:223 (-) Transcript_113236:5-673(-)